MDHPFHYEKPLRLAPETSVVLCTDRNHVKYIRRYFKNIHQVDFLPHAGVELGSRHKPLAERGIDVLYAGALPIYTVAKMIPDLSSIPEVDGQLMAGDVLAELVHHPDRTTEEVIEEYLKDRRSDIPDKRVQEIIVQMRFIDSYATSFSGSRRCVFWWKTESGSRRTVRDGISASGAIIRIWIIAEKCWHRRSCHS